MPESRQEEPGDSRCRAERKYYLKKKVQDGKIPGGSVSLYSKGFLSNRKELIRTYCIAQGTQYSVMTYMEKES